MYEIRQCFRAEPESRQKARQMYTTRDLEYDGKTPAWRAEGLWWRFLLGRAGAKFVLEVGRLRRNGRFSLC